MKRALTILAALAMTAVRRDFSGAAVFFIELVTLSLFFAMLIGWLFVGSAMGIK